MGVIEGSKADHKQKEKININGTKRVLNEKIVLKLYFSFDTKYSNLITITIITTGVRPLGLDGRFDQTLPTIGLTLD